MLTRECRDCVLLRPRVFYLGGLSHRLSRRLPRLTDRRRCRLLLTSLAHRRRDAGSRGLIICGRVCLCVRWEV